MSVSRGLGAGLVLLLATATGFSGELEDWLASAPRGFVVLSARWGTGRGWSDVTDKVRALADESGLETVADRRFGDPLPHWKKALVVTYLFEGRIYTASAAENRRMVLPEVERGVALEACRTGLATRQAKLRETIEAARTRVRERLTTVARRGDLDGIVAAARRTRRDGRALVRAAKPLVADLVAFLDRHPAHAKALDFAAARKAVKDTERTVAAFAAKTRRISGGVRDVTVSVESSNDWRNLEVEVRKGDLLAFAASGRWRAGRWAGDCDATGLSGDRYATHSVIEEVRHAALLIRVGTRVAWTGARSGVAVCAQTGVRVEARCNDETYRDNTGAIDIRVVVVPTGDEGASPSGGDGDRGTE